MSDKKKIINAWDERQARLGNTKRSVLYKNLPYFLNQNIHNQQIKLILNSITPNTKEVLDLGCGYGRVAEEIVKHHKNINLQGVEICKEFVSEYKEKYFDCFHGTVQDYKVDQKKFDLIIIVTVLMYLRKEEQRDNLLKYWKSLSKGGRIVCIEQYDNLLIRCRKKFSKTFFQPTGEKVHYFEKGELLEVLMELPHSKIVKMQNISLVPYMCLPIMHNGYVVEKEF